VTETDTGANTEFDPHRTPGAVIGAVAGGTVVVPFLMVYAFLFIARGTVINVEQPDITSSRTGEAVAGVIALAFLAFIVIGMGRLLNGRDRWTFVVGQLITLGVSVDFLIDTSSGQPEVPVVVALGSVAAIVLSFARSSRGWVRTHGGAATTDERFLPDQG
jgi:hypothetical protein